MNIINIIKGTGKSDDKRTKPILKPEKKNQLIKKKNLAVFNNI